MENRTLYKIDNKDKVRVWKSWSEGDQVIVEHGTLDGKLQQSVYTAEAKNIGKVNESTGTEQAVIEVKALYEDQMTNQHYRKSIEEAQEVKNANLIPRKILNYKDGWKKLPDKCITSVKLNGSRACIINGQLYSKIGRPEEVKHKRIAQGIRRLVGLGVYNVDCEVYAHGIPLQRIRSAWLKPYKTEKEICEVANKRFGLKGKERVSDQHDAIKKLGYNPNEDTAKLKLYIFDVPNTELGGYRDRISYMEQKIAPLVREDALLKEVFGFCEYFETNSHEERKIKLGEYHADGWEGLVHYDPEGLYEFGKRSSNTQKAKPRLESEALVVDCTPDKSGQGVLHLKTNDKMDNVLFKAKMKGDAESRSFEVQKANIGKWVTYAYEELSEKGVPTKPVVLNLRKCDDSGNPVE
jgi:hypothetical protein